MEPSARSLPVESPCERRSSIPWENDVATTACVSPPPTWYVGYTRAAAPTARVVVSFSHHFMFRQIDALVRASVTAGDINWCCPRAQLPQVVWGLDARCNFPPLSPGTATHSAPICRAVRFRHVRFTQVAYNNCVGLFFDIHFFNIYIRRPKLTDFVRLLRLVWPTKSFIINILENEWIKRMWLQ